MRTKHQDQTTRGRSATGAGLMACLAFAAAAVAARGAHWDETWEYAQILAGSVAYPDGHPLAVYVHNAFSVQTWFSGLMASWGLGPWAVCVFRNVLFVLASVLPVFLLASLLTRSVLAGALASLLLMQGILLEFDGSYPSMVWPALYSNGHIGGGAVLLALCALAAGWRRTAYFLGGLLPCVHVGQWPPLAGTLLLYLAWVGWNSRRAGSGASALPFAAWGLAGVACAALFWLVHRVDVQPLPQHGPYAAGGAVEAVWKGYTALHDPHRAFPPGNGHVLLAGTLLLCGFGACRRDGGAFAIACRWLTVYCGLIAAAVWGTMAAHAWFGPDIPFPLIAWMPYRLINQLPPVLLAVATAAILRRWPARGGYALAAAVMVTVLHPLWPRLIGEALHQRYLAGGEAVAFALFGLAFLALAPTRGGGRWIAAGVALFSIAPLAWHHQFGAACAVAAMGVGYALHRIARWRPEAETSRPWPLAVALAIGLAVMLSHQYHHRDPLPVSPGQAAVREALASEADVLLAGPPDSILVQATTGKPVIAEAVTPSLISYVPALGPAIDTLYRDLYGYGFTFPAPGAPPPPHWTEVWRARDRAGWRELRARYGITHVIAPPDVPLDLPAVLAENGAVLYTIPSGR